MSNGLEGRSSPSTRLPPVKQKKKSKRCFLCTKKTGLANSYLCRYANILIYYLYLVNAYLLNQLNVIWASFTDVEIIFVPPIAMQKLTTVALITRQKVANCWNRVTLSSVHLNFLRFNFISVSLLHHLNLWCAILPFGIHCIILIAVIISRSSSAFN